MVPFNFPANTIAGAILSRYTKNFRSGENKPQFKLSPRMKLEPGKIFTARNPIKTLFEGVAATPNPLKKIFSGMPAKPIPIKNIFNGMAAGPNPIKALLNGLSTSVSHLTQKSAAEDYNTVVRKFMPDDAKFLTPQYPNNSTNIQLVDLDGDSQNEIITSYKHNNEIKTIILKKKNDQWIKAGEIHHSEHDKVHYRKVADLTGQGKKQLLLGMSSKDKPSKLYGYSLENDKATQIFTHNYHRIEMLKQPNADNAHFAVWNKKDSDSYDIDVMHWNNSKLEPIKSTAGYYYKSVAPFYASKVKQTPYSPSSWYNLAEALVKGGAHRDALMAIDVGMKVDKASSLKDKFTSLKNEITKS